MDMKSRPSFYMSSFNEYTKTLSKFVLFLFIFLAINNFFEVQLENIAGSTDLYAQVKWNEFYGLPSNSVNLVFIGSSYSYRTFDPEVFDKKLNINSFNMGSPLQKPVETYYVLKETLKYQKPSLVVLDINWGLFNDDKYLNTKLWNFDNMKFSANKIGYLLNVFDVDQYSYALFKTVRYHQHTEELIKKLMGKDVTASSVNLDSYLKNYKGKGFIVDNNVVDVNTIKSKFDNAIKSPKTYVWNKKQLKYLDKIVNLCKKKGIKLIFVTAPQSPIYLELYDAYWFDYENINKTANKIADMYEVEYIDYNMINKEKKLVTNEDFSDSSHLNYGGAQKVSSHLAQYLLNSKGKYFKK